MSRPDLVSVTIRDFRSINGQIVIPLDAPIVLIHGVNGAGKSSVLSAIELALTGAAAGISASDFDDTRHLVHRGRAEAEVVLKVNLGGEDTTSQVLVDATGNISGTAALSENDARTFVERCYLAQSTVSRLLEIYQHRVDRESPLTKFVKDLLGLDKLESLIEGLHPAGDIRRLRHILPELSEAEFDQKRIRRSITDATERLKTVNGEAEETLAELLLVLESIMPEARNISGMAPSELLRLDIPPRSVQPSRPILEAAKQELTGLRIRASEIPPTEQFETAALEERFRAASAALDQWQQAVGNALAETLERAARRFPDLPLLSAGPSVAHGAAQERVRKEVARLGALLQLDEAAEKDSEALTEQLSKTRARSERLAVTLEQEPDRISDLARLLTELIPHVDGETCPVCERDYSEVSSQPLGDYLAKHVATLSSEAKQLQETLGAIREAEVDQRRLRTRISQLQLDRLTAEVRLDLRRNFGDLSDLHSVLLEFGPRILEGEAALGAERQARRELLELRNATSTSAEIRRAIVQLGVALGQPELDEAESLQAAISRLTAQVDLRVAEERSWADARADVTRLRDEFAAKHLAQTEAEQALLRLQVELANVDQELEAFERRRTAVRRLAAAADAARGRVVRQVFNYSLNRTWRDLFVRLVPSEPFVPAFHIVTSANGAVSAELETHHRDGGTGGNPSFMLSAGNLNTGAVTLFLALHLTVDPRLPWLILDDPVQSMDEVHIAQFAALLRTLAKKQDRKLIIAVHERSLFEYLSLELSPAFPGDKLITVEISRPDSGATETNPEFITYNDDRALAAG